MPYHESIRKEPPRRPLISLSVGHLLLGVRPPFKSRSFPPRRPSKHNRTGTHMNSQRLRRYTQGLQRSASDGDLRTERSKHTCLTDP